MPHTTIQDAQSNIEPLAIVGLALRYPGDATDPNKFWKLMIDRQCASSKYPSDRLNVDAHYHSDVSRQDSLSVNGGHFISGDLGAFDAAFFLISPAEAEGMDPQQRIMLETTYQAFDAGISLERASGSQTCVFTGCSSNDYATFYSKDPQKGGKYSAYGQSMNMVANRLSWFYNLKGPSVNVDTACSSGLVALDSACQSIWSGVSTTGLVVGANLIFAREFTNALDNLGVLSQDNRCFTFDERANGYGRGEGVGAIVIKSVKDAIRDGDTIRAVIRSSRSNQDGRTPGITMPNRESQEKLINDTYLQAGLDPALTGYFEAHGTGTPVGDPIEMRAIGAVFRPHRSPENPLYVGSVKSNIGHLESGSGIAGLIKVVLSLEKGVIPPVSENFSSINQAIDVEYLNLKVVSKPVVWPAGIRRASINSFGFGGTNSHVILEDAFHFIENEGLTANHTSCAHPSVEQISFNGSLISECTANGNDAPDAYGNEAHTNGDNIHEAKTNGSLTTESQVTAEPPLSRALEKTIGKSSYLRIVTWSASEESGIERMAPAWKSYFEGLSLISNESELFIDNLAHTLNGRRSRLPWMTYALMDGNTKLDGVVENWKPPIRSQESHNIAYVFSGQGAQWPAMGCELLSRYPMYRHSLVEASKYLQSLGCEWDLLEELQKGEDKSLVNDPTLAQPLCTAIQIALVDLLSLFGIEPTTVIGHSSGEIAAAYCARCISREYAWRLAYFRGLWAANLASSSSLDGAMMAVAMSQEHIEPLLNTLRDQEKQLRVVVACINSPKSITLSGQRSQINALHDMLREKEILARILPIPVAYHSFQMEEIAVAYRESVGDDTQSPPFNPHTHSPQMVSSVNGEWVEGDTLSKAEYWVSNLLSTVQFFDAFKKIAATHSGPPTKKLDGSHRKLLQIDTVVEIGPHAAMRGPCRDILQESGRHMQVEYLSVLTRKACGVRTVLETLAQLCCLGYAVDLNIVNCKPSKTNKKEPKVLSDLPPYQFNKTKSYWREGPISKSFRFRRFGRHELLGWPDDDWNPLLPKWNNFLQPSNPVWVRDHQINNTILIPGAAMLSMAIEATKQLISPEKEITGFNFKSVGFLSALIVPAETTGVETRLCMRPQRDDDSRTEGWYEFSLFSYNDSWTRNCTGSIKASIKEPSKKEVDVSSLEKEEALEQLRQITACSTTILDANQFYESLKLSSLQFGPSFRVIDSVATDQIDHLVTDIKTYTSDAPTRWNETYTIHPTTLDGLMQSTQVLRSQAGRKRIPPSIPIRLDKAWISNVGLSRPDPASVKVGTTLRHEGRHESTFNLTAASHSAKETLLTVEGVTFRVIDSQQSADEYGTSPESSQCHQIEWKPDFDLMSQTEILQFLKDTIPDSVGPAAPYLNMELIIAGFIFRAESSFAQGETEMAALAHTTPYLDWLKHQMQATQDGKSRFSSEYWQKQIHDDVNFGELCVSVEKASQQGKMLVNTGRALVECAQGKYKQPLSSILNAELLEDSYEELFRNAPGVRRWRAYMDTLGHKHPGMKILEIDGSLGSISHLIIDTLTSKSPNGHYIARFARFDICHGDPNRLSTLQTRLGDCSSRVSFKELDFGNNLGSGVLESPEKYDLVIVCLAFHDFASIETSLSNMKQLLTECGKLVIIDMVNPDSNRSAFVNGLNESWWINTESYRSVGHCIGESKWDEVLRQSGFSGSDLVFRDYDDLACHEISVIVSTSTQVSTTIVDQPYPPMAVLLDSARPLQRSLADDLNSRIQKGTAGSVEMWPINETLPIPLSQDLICIALLEMDGPLLADMDQNVFQKIQQLAAGCRKILWIGLNGTGESSPFFRVVDGLFRVLNSEDSRGIFTTLSIDSTGFQADQVTRVLRAMVSSTELETEYVEKRGFLHIPRLVEAPRLSHAVRRLQSSQYPTRLQWNSAPPLKLAIGPAGMLDGLQFVEDVDRKAPLPADMLEIKVKAVGANFRDVLVLLGRMDQTTLGFECAGVVTRVGKECTDFQVGDQVLGCNFDSYRSYARLHQAATIKVPSGMSFSHAAAIPTNFVTAWHTLVSIANVQSDETVLIHSAAGGTGQAAIQVAQYLGANVFATVGNAEKKTFLMKRYGIPESHIFSSRNTDFAACIKRLTSGKGVDVLLNSLSGEGLVASWECIAPYGRFLEIGKRDILAHAQLDMFHFARNVTFSAVDLALVVQERPHLIGKALRALMPLVSAGTLRVSEPLRVYGINELETGLRKLQGGQSSGKVVFEMRDHDVIDTLISPRTSHSFDPNATYIIAGGLGGLGKSIVRWMVTCGARYLLLLSRSGAHTRDAQAFIRELAGHHVTAQAPACDITNRSMLEAVLGEVSYTMPPIKGFIQATVVLQDAMFQQMTHAQWVQATAPKITGTWNLHQLLPSGLDFFIMLSSISSIMGNRGQANYAAANGFMDALAHHRVAQGENATSLNLGFFLSTGLVAQTSSLKDRYTSSMPFIPVTEVELHALLSIYCDPYASQANETSCQTIIGVTSPRDLYKRNPEATYWLEKPAFRQILTVDHAESTKEQTNDRNSSGQVGKSLLFVDSVDAAGATLTDLLISKLSKTLGVPKEDMHGQRPLHSYGVDSLVAVELRNWFFKEFDVDVAIFDMLGGTTITAVGNLAAGKIFAKREA